mgnify:CR=1 FL=1
MYIYLVPVLPCRFCGLRGPRRRPPGHTPRPAQNRTDPHRLSTTSPTPHSSTPPQPPRSAPPTQKLPRRTPGEPRTIFTSTQFRVRPWWWGRLGSNQRPIGYEPTALTPELRPRETYYSASEVIIEVFQRQFARLLTKK